MRRIIHLQVPEAGRDDPRKLNLFPGRALSEREFELLQAYVDDRVAPLVRLLPAGIVSGLQLQISGGGSATRLRVQPGQAVGGGGQLVRLFYPLETDWPALAEQAERDADSPLLDGIYFLTLRASVQEIDPATELPPATRREVDPLRDRRLETVIIPGLQRVSVNSRWLAMRQAEIANRVCVEFLTRSPFEATAGAVPLGLVKVVARRPEWIDAVAGRYLAEDDAAYRTLLAHTATVWQRLLRDNPRVQALLEGSSTQRPDLAELLGIPYLPAAGPLPQFLVQDPAGNPPRLVFAARDLGIDLIPVPASTVQGIIAEELPRGTIDLIHARHERIRLLLAIPDLEFRHDLLDLPPRDLELERQLFLRYNQAAHDWSDWRSQWQQLFGRLSADALRAAQAPALVAAPLAPDAYRDQLVAERRRALPDDDLPLPEPWLSHVQAPYRGQAVPPTPDLSSDGLLHQRAALQGQISALEGELAESFALLNEVGDYLGLQRQQLDALTLSFSALAGGVSGDGSGLKLMRWAQSGALTPDLTNSVQSTAGGK